MRTIEEVLNCVNYCMFSKGCTKENYDCCYGDKGLSDGVSDLTERTPCDVRLENDYKKIMAEVKKINTFDRLQEICNAERDGRLVVLPCGVDLMKIYNELTSVCEGDGVENYTNGYRWGHKNGQIELIRRILNISEGVSHKPEQALKGGAV